MCAFSGHQHVSAASPIMPGSGFGSEGGDKVSLSFLSHCNSHLNQFLSTKLHTNNKWCKALYVLLFSPLSCTLNVFQMIATVTTPSRLTLMHSRRTSRTRRRMSARWWKLRRTMSWLWQRSRWRWRRWSWRRWRWSSREASSRGGRIVPTIPAATLEPSLTLALCDYSKGLWLWCLLWGWLWLQWYWLWLLLLQVPWQFVSVLKNPCNNHSGLTQFSLEVHWKTCPICFHFF